MITPTQQIRPAVAPTRHDETLHRAAEELEATFLAEMLKSAGLSQSRDAFGGGEGEDQFASFLINEQARQIVRSGGIGLTEMICQSLQEKNNAE